MQKKKTSQKPALLPVPIDKEEEKVVQKETTIKVFPTGIIICLLGISIGMIVTFYWNNLSILFLREVAFPTITFALFLLFILVVVLLVKFFSRTAKVSYEKIAINLDIAIKNKAKRKEGLVEVFKEAKKYFSLSGIIRIATLVTGIIVTILGGVIAIQQNQLVDIQNKLFQNQNEMVAIQNNLAEASRRSSFVFMMSNIMDILAKEVTETKDSPPFSKERQLSEITISRISALNQVLKPYKYLENDTLIPLAVSPERGQLLLVLANAKLDTLATYPSIFNQSKFKGAYLEDANLKAVFLKEVNLRAAYLKGVDLSNATLNHANLIRANLSDADLNEAKLIGTNLTNANLENTDFRGANLTGCQFGKANMKYTDFRYSDLIAAKLKHADLSKAKLRGAKFKDTDLSYTIFAADVLESVPNFEGAIMQKKVFTAKGAFLKRNYTCIPLMIEGIEYCVFKSTKTD